MTEQNTPPLHYNHNQTRDDDAIDIKDIVATLFNAKWLIGITTLVFIIIGVLFCLFRTPIYQTSLMLNISTKGSNALESSVLQSTAIFGGFGRTDPVSTESNIISSRAVLEPVIKKLKLNIEVSPIYFPLFGKRSARIYNNSNFSNTPAPAKFGFSPYDWGGAQLQISNFQVSPALLNKNFMVITGPKHQYKLLLNNTVLGTGLVGKALNIKLNTYQKVSLTIKSLIANIGTEFSIKKLRMIDALKRLNGMLAVSQTNKLASLLSITVTGTQPKKIAQIANAIALSAQKQSITEKSEQAGKTLQFLKARIPSVQSQLITAEQALNTYKSHSGNISISAQGKALLTQITQIETQLTSLSVAKANLLSQYTQHSYQVQQVNTQIKALKTERAKLNTLIRSLPNADQKLMQLSRNVAVQNAVYTNLLSNLQKFELLKEGTIGDVQIVDNAYIPYYKTNKPAKLILILFAFLGLLLSIGLTFIRKFLFRGIEDPEIIENKFQIPVFGTLHQSKNQAKQLQKFEKGQLMHMQILDEIDSNDVCVESFRSLRTNLIFELAKTDNNVIAISGPVPNVGKSFVSVNIAAALAEANKKVLLIDGDIRKGDIFQYFKRTRYPGLCDLLSGTAKLEECLHHTRIHNLDFIATGRLPKRHTQILVSKNFNELLDYFKQQYDVVIIDTAPVLAVTDAFIIGKNAGTRLLVMGYGMHDEREVKLTQLRYQKAGVEISGCVFNMIKMSTSGLSYKYQYAYKYTSKPEKSDKKSNKKSDQ